MWYKLNQAFGVILLVALVGGGGAYGLYKFVSGPPLLRQEGQPEGQYQKQARKDLESACTTSRSTSRNFPESD